MKFYSILSIFILYNLSVSTVLSDIDCPFDVSGLIAAVFTPFDKNDNLNLAIIPQYAQYLQDKKLNGVFVAGYIGEGTKLTAEELKDLTTAWVDATRNTDLKVIVVIGGRPFSEILDVAVHAEDVGVDAIAILADLLFKPKTAMDEVYAMEVIARSVPNTPILYHDIPVLTGLYVDIAELFLEGIKRIPSFRGVSVDDYGDSFRVSAVYLSDTVKVYICNSTLFGAYVNMAMYDYIFPELNFFSDRYKEAYNAALAAVSGNLTWPIYLDLYDYANAISSTGYSVPPYKAAMNMLTGIDVGPPRQPERPLSEDQKIQMRQRLRKLGVNFTIPEQSYYFEFE